MTSIPLVCSSEILVIWALIYPPVNHNDPFTGLRLIRLQKAAAPVSIHLSSAVFGETVPISNGGYVIIQHTEALHAIDVNSGKTSKASNQEESALNVNLDAAETIARQLRLRDIGGIIVIDFIDLKKISNKRKIFEAMKKAMSEDRSKHTILPLSKFCLMQITRQRVRQELKMTKEDAELDQEGTEAADKIEQKIEHLFVKQNEKNLTLVVHPYLYSYFTIGVLSRQYKWFIKHRRWVKIEKDNNIGVKDYVFLDSNRQIIQTKKWSFLFLSFSFPFYLVAQIIALL